jgi:hypothetical protein
MVMVQLCPFVSVPELQVLDVAPKSRFVNETPVRVSVTPVLFMTVKSCPTLVCPCAMSPKFMDAGFRAMVPTPVPERGTTWGLPVTLSKILSCAVRDPTAAGVNTTSSTQVEDWGMDCPAAHCPPTAWSEKSPGFVPVMVAGGVPMTRFALVVLVMVTTFGGVDAPTDIFPKATDAGEMFTPGLTAEVPVPDRATLNVPAEVVIVSVADRAPVEVGEKWVTTAQVPPFPATVPVQVLELLGKSAVLPVVTTDVIVMLEAVGLVSVAVCVALEPPTTMLPKFSESGLTLTTGELPWSGSGYV